MVRASRYTNPAFVLPSRPFDKLLSSMQQFEGRYVVVCVFRNVFGVVKKFKERTSNLTHQLLLRCFSLFYENELFCLFTVQGRKWCNCSVFRVLDVQR